MVASQSAWLSGKLDVFELRTRRWHGERWVPYPHRTAVLRTALLLIAFVICLAVWFVWSRGWLPGPVQEAMDWVIELFPASHK